MIIIAIDPGPVDSAFCVLRDHLIIDYGKEANKAILDRLLMVWSGSVCTEHLIIEQVACYGMPVGEDVFETVFWSGRFAQAWPRHVHRLTRLAVKMHLCHTTRAKDANVRQALIDLLGPVGTKKHPGPCYGLSGDVWAALAVGVTWIALATAISHARSLEGMAAVALGRHANVAQARANPVTPPPVRNLLPNDP